MEGEAANVKCPVCSDKLDVDIKLKSVQCHGCGWTKTLYRQN